MLRILSVLLWTQFPCHAVGDNIGESYEGQTLSESYAYLGKLCEDPGTINFCGIITDLFRKKVKDEPITIGLLGTSGVGKSTLTNTVIGLKSNEPGSAPTCNNQECTGAAHEFNKKGYMAPGLQIITFVDAPGCGTKTFQKDAYIKEIGVDSFDAAVLVLAAPRPGVDECEVMLFEYMKSTGKPLYLVLNRINEVLDNANDHSVPSKEEEARRITISKENFVNGPLQPDAHDVFALDARYKSKALYDMPAFRQRLAGDVGRLLKAKLVTIAAKHVEDRDYHAQVVIHTASAATSLISAMSVLPGVSILPNSLIQIAMMIVLGQRYQVSITSGMAINFVVNNAGQTLGVGVGTWVSEAVGLIPLWGPLAKGSVVGAATESIGWSARHLMKTDPDEFRKLALKKDTDKKASSIDWDSWSSAIECMAGKLGDAATGDAAVMKAAWGMVKCFRQQSKVEL